MAGKLELYEDAFELEKALEGGPARRLAAGLNPRAGRMLEGVAALGKGERESLHLYHDEQADAVLSDDWVSLRLLEETAGPYLTPTSLVVRLLEAGRLSRGESLDALNKLERHIRGSVYERAKRELEKEGGARKRHSNGVVGRGSRTGLRDGPKAAGLSNYLETDKRCWRRYQMRMQATLIIPR